MAAAYHSASGPHLPPDDWYSDERPIRSVLIQELQRLKRRMKSHPLRVLLLASLMTLAVVVKYARKPTLYKARIILRVSESELSDERGAPMPTYNLETYIYTKVLNERVLLDNVIHKYNLHREELETDGEKGAIEEFREGLSIGAFRNYFFHDSRFESIPRSLRIAVIYKHKDPEYAYKIASILTELVVRMESTKRLRETHYAAENAREAYIRSVAQVAARQQRRSQLLVDMRRAIHEGDDQRATTAAVVANELGRRIDRDEDWLFVLRRDVRKIEFRQLMEERKIGLFWELAGEERPRPVPPPGPIQLSILAVFCLCIFVPACAIGFGALDSKLHVPEDVSRLGIPVVGHIPAFAGDQVGSLRARGALEKRSAWSRLGLGKSRRPSKRRVV